MESLGITLAGLVQTNNKKPITTSLKIAEVFEKRHDNVLRDIETLNVPEEFSALNFEGTNYTDKQGKTKKSYEITKDGFTLLAMGYTGDKAMKFKLAYINAFNQMEELLIQQRVSKVLAPVHPYCRCE
jgi:Rha family phage regulatory protein